MNEKGDRQFRLLRSLQSPYIYLEPRIQHGVKENYCIVATFNRIVDTKTIVIQMGPNTCILNVG